MKKRKQLSTEVVKRNALTGSSDAPKKRFGKKEKKKYTIIIILIIVALCAGKYGLNIYETQKAEKEREASLGSVTEREGEIPSTNDEGEVVEETDEIKVYSINIGNGNSTLIKCNDTDVLIDGGEDISKFVSKHISGPLEYVVVTNSYDENIKGLPKLYETVDVENTIVANIPEKASKEYTTFKEAAGTITKNEGQIIQLTDKSSIVIGNGIKQPKTMEDKTAVVSVINENNYVVITGKASSENIKQSFANEDSNTSFVITDGKPQRLTKEMIKNNISSVVISSKNPKKGGTLDNSLLNDLYDSQTSIYTTYRNGTILIKNQNNAWEVSESLIREEDPENR